MRPFPPCFGKGGLYFLAGPLAVNDVSLELFAKEELVFFGKIVLVIIKDFLDSLLVVIICAESIPTTLVECVVNRLPHENDRLADVF